MHLVVNVKSLDPTSLLDKVFETIQSTVDHTVEFVVEVTESHDQRRHHKHFGHKDSSVLVTDVVVPDLGLPGHDIPEATRKPMHIYSILILIVKMYKQ